MTVSGFKKIFNEDTFTMIKTTGGLEVHFSRLVKGSSQIDETNELFIFKDINGLTCVLDMTDICCVTFNPDGNDKIGSLPWNL